MKRFSETNVWSIEKRPYLRPIYIDLFGSEKIKYNDCNDDDIAKKIDLIINDHFNIQEKIRDARYLKYGKQLLFRYCQKRNIYVEFEGNESDYYFIAYIDENNEIKHWALYDMQLLIQLIKIDGLCPVGKIDNYGYKTYMFDCEDLKPALIKTQVSQPELPIDIPLSLHQ